MSAKRKPDGLGLDKAARNELNRSRKEADGSEQEGTELRLEPPFPFSMIPFDPDFFDT